MAFSIPISGFLSTQFRSHCIRNTKRLEQVVKIFSIREFKNQFFQHISIFQCVVDGL